MNMRFSPGDYRAPRPVPAVVAVCFAWFSASCGQSPRPGSKATPSATVTAAGTLVDTKLSGFAQEITTTTKALALTTGQTIRIPVVIGNPGPDTWISFGKAPITFSYRWYIGAEDKVAVTERTLLPRPLLPGQSVALDATIVAPPAPGRYTLRLSMVQEGIAWFMEAGGLATDLPVIVR